MAHQGCNLILHGRRIENVQEVLDEVKGLGVEAYAVSAELSDLDAVKQMLEDIDRLGVRVDIVLNNAGMLSRRSTRAQGAGLREPPFLKKSSQAGD